MSTASDLKSVSLPHTIGHVISAVSAVVCVAVVAGLGYLVSTQAIAAWKASQEQALKHEAIRTCAEISKFSVTETDSKTGKTSTSEQPNEKIYTKCIQDKGYTLQ